jgi:hypothetical protein
LLQRILEEVLGFVCIGGEEKEERQTDRQTDINIYTYLHATAFVSGFLFSVVICKPRSDDDGFLVLDSFCVQALNKSFETWVSKEFFSRILFPFIILSLLWYEFSRIRSLKNP